MPAKSGRRWVWFAGLYVASVGGAVIVVYGLRWLSRFLLG